MSLCGNLYMVNETPLYLKIIEIAVTWILLGVFLWGISWLYQYISRRLEEWRRNLRDQKDSPNIALKVITATKAKIALTILYRLSILISLIILIPAILSFSLSLFPATAHLSERMIHWFREPAIAILHGFLDYLPNLGFLIVWCIFIFFLIRLLNVFSRWVDSGLIVLPGFHPEWAEPTSRILSFLIIAFALVVAFPYMPGGGSPAFQGVSIFIGVLVSIGSGSAIGNIISGIILTYTRAFRMGDRVRIGDHMGDVIEKSAFVTRIRTIKNEDIVIPNSTVMSSHIVNYMEGKHQGGLILNTIVTMGYDIPWPKVHEVLIQAALRTEGILAQPAPFVFQTALHDFNVAYQINAYTHLPGQMARIYSDLYRNILDLCHQNGIDPKSPTFHVIQENHSPSPYPFPSSPDIHR